MDLYIENKLTFEKIGMEVRLSEDPNDWPQQILDELYRQAPYISDYAPKVVLPTVDGDRRYGLGQIELVNRMAINPRDDSTPSDLKGTQKVAIPVIIQDGRMKPVDVLMYDGKVEPLTEERLRRAMFRPNLFEAIRERPGDVSLIEQLYPPHRQYGGARGPLMADIGASGVSKEGSVKPDFLMDAIQNSLYRSQVKQLGNLLKTAAIKDVAGRTYIAGQVLDGISKIAGIEKTASAPNISDKAVVQLEKLEDGFRIKIADPQDLAAPQIADVSRPEAVSAMGPEAVGQADQIGAATMAPAAAMPAPPVPDPSTPQVITEFGRYSVTEAGTNKTFGGWVFPSVLDLSGEKLPLAIFSNGKVSAAQEAIAGVSIDSEEYVLDGPPQGDGCFYYYGAEGPIALVPLTVESEIETEDGKELACTTMMGEQVAIKKVPDLQELAQIDETTYAIPEESGFLPFGDEVNLSTGAEDVNKVAEARAIPNAVRVITDGSTYTFQGAPIDKVASVLDTEFISKNDAVFLGAVLGQEPNQFTKDLNGIRKHAHQELWFSAKPVVLWKEKKAAALPEKIASAIPSLDELVKEALAIDDPSAVDKILSLGFINPENVMTFTSYIPEIESIIRKLAELLVASRLGLHSVEEGALSKALMHLDKIVAGLKTLQSDIQA